METLPLVSVILPTYNRAELIQRAINSVLTQTYSNWELVIWDDGSTDNSGEIVNSYHDARIRYFFDTNHGVAYARNRAIEVSQGNYLAFLDSDDEWELDKLDGQVNVMSSFPRIDVLFSDFLNVDVATNERYRIFDKYSSVMKRLGTLRCQSDLYLIKTGMPQILAEANFIATDTVMLRTETMLKVGRFAEELKRSEDFELWWRIGLEELCFAYQDKVYLNRFKETDSLSRSSILSCRNTIDALNLCAERTRQKKREELMVYLNEPMRNVWQHLLILYGNNRNYRKMFSAFWQSLQFGFRPGSVKLLVKGLLN